MAQFMHHTAAVAARVSRLIAGALLDSHTRPQTLRLERGLGPVRGIARIGRIGQKTEGYHTNPRPSSRQSAPKTSPSRQALNWCFIVGTPAVAVH